MATDYTATDTGSGVATQSVTNAEWAALQLALERSFNLYGDSTNGVNALQVDMDFNSNDILNGGVGNFTDIVVAGTSLATQVADAAASAAAALVSETAAAVSAAAALVSENAAAADAILTAADVVLTHADVVLTNADVVSTTADAAATALDVIATNADVVLTNADVVLTGLDVIATNADVVLTGLDVVSTNADVVLTGLDVVATGADVTAAASSASAASISAAAALVSELAAAASAAAAAGAVTYENMDANGDVGTGAGQLAIGNHVHAASEITTPDIGTPTYNSVQDNLNTFHSAGIIAGCILSDGGSGTVDIAAGSGFIRATDSTVVNLLAFDISAVTALVLTDQQINYIYIEYNAGSPQIIATTTERTDLNTNVSLGNVYRDGTTAHVNTYRAYDVDDHAGKMITRLIATSPMAYESGAALAETGTLNFSLTAGTFWEGFNSLTTNAFDSSVADTFSYFYRDGASGWTEVTGQSAIDNTRYDNNSGSLATLSTPSRYGVHWVYIATDSDVYVIYGQGDYTLTQAQEAQPDGVPPHIPSHATLAGKIIIQKSITTFYSIASAFDFSFTAAGVTDHLFLSNIGTNTHAQIDTHIADSTLHFTEASIDHTAIANVGTNTHVQIDTHIALTNEHIDWTADQGATNIHAGNYIDTNTTYISSDFVHDDLTGFVANEHIDWTADQGATNIHSGNYIDTTYSVGDGGLTEINFTSADNTKLDGIEALADVTDVTNVTAAGALMDSEVDADIKTLVLPANTTISTFGASLIDDVAAINARSTLGLIIGTDVQPFSATNTLDIDVVYALLDTNGDVGTGAGQLAIGNHTHTGVYLADLVDDTTPQLGGNLDLNGKGIPVNLNTQTGTTYTGVLADQDKVITMNNAAANTFTIPANASVAYAVGTKLNFMQLGAGATTIAITTDTLNVDATYTKVLDGQYSIATALKITSTSWVLFGNLVAA